MSTERRAAATPEGLFAELVSTAATRPFVTYYDTGSGERSELSVRSLANWVAKTHFLLLDELGLGVGDRAAVPLPAHWISVPVLLGCWSAGLAISADRAAGDPADTVDVAFVTPDSAASFAGAGQVYSVDPAAAARGFGAEAPAGTQDYVTAVRPQPDAWATVRSVAGPADPAVGDASRADTVRQARELAETLQLAPGGRLLLDADSAATSFLDAVLLTLVVGGSLVVTAGGGPATETARLAAQERVTAPLP